MVRRRALNIVVSISLLAVTLARPGGAAASPSAPPAGAVGQPITLPLRLADGRVVDCACVPRAPRAPRPPWQWTTRRRAGLAALGVGVLSASVAVGLEWSAHRLEESSSAGQAGRSSANAAIRRRDVAASILLGAAAASVVAGALLVLWPVGPTVTVTQTGQAFFGYRGTM